MTSAIWIGAFGGRMFYPHIGIMLIIHEICDKNCVELTNTVTAIVESKLFYRII